MQSKFKVAAVQMNSSEDKVANLRAAAQLVERAAEMGATLIALPELFNCLGRFEAVLEQAEPPEGETHRAMSQLAKRLQITLVAGSIAEQDAASGRAMNTSLMFGPDGSLLAKYRKIHLFDVDLPGAVSITESHWLSPGFEIVTSPTPYGRLGHAICYDLRFPELFREMATAGMDLLCLPSAFTMATGRAHWEVLLRARAIENQVYLIAPNQSGMHGEKLSTYGHSAVIDPWGELIAVLGHENQGIAIAEVDPQRLRDVRSRVPALNHRVIFSHRE